MIATNIEARMRSIIAERLGVGEDEVKPEKDFVKDLGADSLDMIDLVMAFEEAFKMEIPEEKQENIKTVQDAFDYVNGNQA